MIVAIGSAFRNSALYVRRYMQQVHALQHVIAPHHHVRVIAVECDSTDRTREMLHYEAQSYNISLELLTHNHGKRSFGSTEEPERLEALSGVGNAIFDGVSGTDDALVYVESDLLWDPRTIAMLLDMAYTQADGFDVIAPLPFAGSAFYDIWAFRKNGERFVPFAPYHIALNEEGLTEVDSVGSCLVMRGDVARRVRILNNYGLVGWCENARTQGYRIAAHAQTRVYQQ